MFGIEYTPGVDLALKKAAREVHAYLVCHERVVLADAASFRLLAPHDHDGRDLWLVCGLGAEEKVETVCPWQIVGEDDFKNMKDLYHLYEFSPYFLLLEEGSPYLQGMMRLQQEKNMSMDDLLEVLFRR